MELEFREKIWIEWQLEKAPFVEWDRYIKKGLGYLFYGWIDREDQYKDFVTLELNPMTENIIGYSTSSKRMDDKLNELYGRDSMTNDDCKRVENQFNIKNMIEL